MKLNKSKVNKSKVEQQDLGFKKQIIIYPFNTEQFIEKWQLWKNYKLKEFNFKYKTIQSEQAALKKLSDLSNNIEQMAIDIIHESFANGWKADYNIN